MCVCVYHNDLKVLLPKLKTKMKFLKIVLIMVVVIWG